MPQDKRRLAIAIGMVLALVVAFTLVYRAGLPRGRVRVRQELLTAQADLVAALSSTPTVTETPTETLTPTPSLTPTPTWTPTQTPTPTSTPASPEEWADRFQTLVEEGLNAISVTDFNGGRAESLLRRIAQEQGLQYVPATHFEISSDPWAALVIPRTPQGDALPMIFWREANDRNRVRSQNLAAELGGNSPYSTLLGGLSDGLMRSDFLGRLHVLLVERPEVGSLLSALVLAQPRPGGDFEVLWRSSDELLWSIQASGSGVELADIDGALLPDMVILAPLAVGGGLRDRLGAPDVFIEQVPYGRQWADSQWRFLTLEDAIETGGASKFGYNLLGAALRSTPLTSISQLLGLLREGNVGEASNYVGRFDLLQQVYDMGLSQPAAWLGYYLADGDEAVYGNEITPRLLIFDNGNRERTYTADFEQGADGVYRLVALFGAEPYRGSEIVTPAPPVPTWTATVTPRAVDTPTRTRTPQLTDDRTAPSAESAEGEAASTPVPGTDRSTATSPPGPTATPVPTATSTSSPTWTPTVTSTFTPPPTVTGTSTPTFTPTSTPTNTATATSTEVPYPIPDIAEDQAPLAVASIFRSPANLRAGPETSYVPVAQLNYGVHVDLYGITESGKWVLFRVNEPYDLQDGAVGWMSTDLLLLAGDTAFLPRYRTDGTPVVPSTPTFTPTVGTPQPTPTMTPRLTPVIRQPAIEPLVEMVAPPPVGGEVEMTVGGGAIPANPVAPLPAVTADGRTVSLAVDTATIEIWSGVFGTFPSEWIPAPVDLLWPDTRVYVTGSALPQDENVLVADRVRIAEAPKKERVRMISQPEIAAALDDETAVALMGSREESGVYMLETVGTLRQQWINEQDAYWVNPDGRAGIVVSEQGAPTGINSFNWIRSDGVGIQVFAQPFHSFGGVTGDLYSGLWWIERPQADLDQWQLWQYDPYLERIILRLRASGDVFQTGIPIVTTSLTPSLISAQAEFEPESGAVSSVTLLLDTEDAAAQRLYEGVFRIKVQTDGDGEGEVLGQPQILLSPESYRGPLRVSPDGTKLAYFVYDPEHPSLTSGVIRPANKVRVLTLFGRGASTIVTVYGAENRFEFLAPNLEWLGNDRLVLARSRFAAGETFGLDRFAIVQAQLPGPGATGGEWLVQSHLLPDQQQLRDFAVCQDGEYTLTVAIDKNDELFLSRWTGAEPPQPLFVLPANITRAFLCWQAPDALLAPQ